MISGNLFSSKYPRGLIKVLLYSLCVIVSLLFVEETECKLSISKECGDFICSDHQYCSKIDHFCRNCHDACNSENNNYDKSICEQDCQDFLHDQLYQRRSEENLTMDDIQRMALYKEKVEEELSTIKLLIGFVLISLTIMLFLLTIIAIFIMKNRYNLFNLSTKTASPNDFPIIYNKHCQKDDISLNVSQANKNDSKSLSESKSPSESKSVLTPSTQSIKTDQFSVRRQPSFGGRKLQREPSESTLPEYAYDNPTLVPSPTHHM